ncbi:hypothetical protein P879_02004 [Paragonimus westermani]|uniref:Uncharacterized protein n=2 Tax=Paragonimus westermani TaxID=34504 RepID=A0A8T0DIZ7_9TREM|nr:hypothetical protein P879_02004 [Paragonimus westermani]
MLNRPASPGSRRSSTLSNTGMTGTSTAVQLYSRIPVKKKTPVWRLASHPLPVNLLYRRSLLLALLLSCLASLVFLIATLNRKWESVYFNYERVFQFLDFEYGPTTDSTAEVLNSLTNQSNTDEHNFTVDYIVYENGHLAHPADVKRLKIIRMNEPYSVKQVCGLFTKLRETGLGQPLIQSFTIHQTQRLHSRGSFAVSSLGKRKVPRPAYVNEDVEFLENDRSFEPEVAWIVMNYYSSIWNMYYQRAHIYETHLYPHYYDVCKGPGIPGSRLSYFANNISETRITCTQFFLKMQNNIISCVIVVYLCMMVSTVIGIFATLFRNVPASMVTGVLHVTSGVFVIFANCIHHTKLNRLESEWGPCHPLSRLPEQLYQPEFITVSSHWPLTVSWISSPIFFIASFAWIVLTQVMTTENSKMLI